MARSVLDRYCVPSPVADNTCLPQTVEVLALLLNNPAAPTWTDAEPLYDRALETNVKQIKATLIVAPETLREQWIEESDVHAPSLRVYSFKGYAQVDKDTAAAGEKSWADFAQRFDIIVLSYDVLRKEFHTARTAPERSRRHERKYDRRRSPLVQVCFWRVCMDEVQLVGEGYATETVSMIPRRSSIAVSGTPFKTVTDMRSCFKFLRIPGNDLANAWPHLNSSIMRDRLLKLLSSTSTRHTKAEVQDEMVIPPQTRSLVPIDFTSIEGAFYNDQWIKGCSELRLTERGAMVDPHGAIDLQLMRLVLSRLRRACTHPQIVLRSNANTLGAVATFNLRSLDDVLDLMLDGARAEYYTNRHALVTKQINRAQLMLQNKEDEQRHVKARDTLDDLCHLIQEVLASLRKALEDADLQGPLYRFTQEEIRQRTLSASSGEEEHSSDESWRARSIHITQLKGRRRDVSHACVYS